VSVTLKPAEARCRLDTGQTYPELIRAALAEDIGAGDAPPPRRFRPMLRARGTLLAKSALVVAGSTSRPSRSAARPRRGGRGAMGRRAPMSSRLDVIAC
jgi:hypothetical protein